jgi:hypothetical protein
MTYFKSLAEVVFLAWLAAFLGLVTVAGFDVLDIASWKAAAVAAVPAALAALYGAVAKLVGDKSSPLVTAPKSATHRVGDH